MMMKGKANKFSEVRKREGEENRLQRSDNGTKKMKYTKHPIGTKYTNGTFRIPQSR